MCTAATYKTKDFYFGRTLDYEFSYGDEIVVTPRNYPLAFRHVPAPEQRYAMIGMAHVADGYPLYYDAINEAGLGMAGLNFVGNAAYGQVVEGRENVAQFEFIPWILCQCASVRQARERLARIQLTATPFSDRLPCAQLHWLIADRDETIVVESMADGLHVHDNPVGVLTNNPPFDVQLFLLNNYMSLSAGAPENRFAPKIDLRAYSRGMGAMGLPGDLSSASRFAKVAFTKLHSLSADDEASSVSQFFHILGSVEQQRGCCEVADGKYEITLYTSCCNATRGIYYYTTYENARITAVDMHRTNLNAAELTRYAPAAKQDIFYQN